MSCCTEWPQEEDEELHEFYARKLLVPGWAGVLSKIELRYIQGKLHTSRKLSYEWGFAPSQKTRPEAAIRRVAMDGIPRGEKEDQGKELDWRRHNMMLARPRKSGRRRVTEAILRGVKAHEPPLKSGKPAHTDIEGHLRQLGCLLLRVEEARAAVCTHRDYLQ